MCADKMVRQIFTRQLFCAREQPPWSLPSAVSWVSRLNLFSPRSAICKSFFSSNTYQLPLCLGQERQGKGIWSSIGSRKTRAGSPAEQCYSCLPGSGWRLKEVNSLSPGFSRIMSLWPKPHLFSDVEGSLKLSVKEYYLLSEFIMVLEDPADTDFSFYSHYNIQSNFSFFTESRGSIHWIPL